jgi:hypothetical protein
VETSPGVADRQAPIYCLAHAADAALDRSKEWVALAEAAGIDDGVELPVVRFVVDESKLLEVTELDDADRKRIEDRIQRLDGFKKMAAALASSLRHQLKQSRPSKGRP